MGGAAAHTFRQRAITSANALFFYGSGNASDECLKRDKRRKKVYNSEVDEKSQTLDEENEKPKLFCFSGLCLDPSAVFTARLVPIRHPNRYRKNRSVHESG